MEKASTFSEISTRGVVMASMVDDCVRAAYLLAPLLAKWNYPRTLIEVFTW